MEYERKQPHELAIRMALLAILLMAAAFRFFNVNWDKGTYHIHPDERNTAMVAIAIQWPKSLAEYFDTSHSPLNPENKERVYFYGTLPLFLDKYLAIKLHMDNYDQIHLVGRVLSALFDLGSVLIVFFLGRRLFGWRVGLLASFLLALAVLSIQGSHYFAVDTFLTFFVTLTLWFILDLAEGGGWLAFLATGISLGLTMACKVSVFFLVLIVVFGAWLGMRRRIRDGLDANRAALRFAGGLVLAGLMTFAVFRVAQPYAWAGPNYNGWDAIPAPWGERVRLFEKVPEPIRAVLMPNPQWIADIVSAGEQQTGKADMPWGRQWTGRTKWVYPMENMVIWGLGVPLGLAAWAGVTLVAVQLVLAWRRRRRAVCASLPESRRSLAVGYQPSAVSHQPSATRELSATTGDAPPLATVDDSSSVAPAGSLSSLVIGHWSLVIIPLIWVVLLFLWQGAQFVKSIRYFLPIYPCLAIFGAYLVVAAWDWAVARRPGLPMRRVAHAAAGALGVFVLIGTLAWAFAFIEIYRHPITRVDATRWMYENVESAATLHYHTASGQAGQIQIPTPASYEYVIDGQMQSTPFTVPQDVIATDVVMNNLTGENGPAQATFQARIVAGEVETTTLATAQVQGEFSTASRRHVLALPDVPLVGGKNYYLETIAINGVPLLSEGSAIANEHFDDPLPFNMDGRVAFGPSGPYRSLQVSYPGSPDVIDQLQLYDEDTPEKLSVLVDALDQADYIVMSSGRLLLSIPRLPMRYPMTTRYYQLLLAGKLGFEKAAEFHSYPRLFGIEFNDTSAEEQFTVYDHPKVLIYRKTASFNKEQVRTLLGQGIDWNTIAHGLNPRDVPAWERMHKQQNSLMLTPAERQVQEQGGTWSDIFNRDSLPNRLPTYSWYILVMLLGLVTLPLTLVIFGRLPDRGYILARPAGVLLLAWLSWMLTNLTPLQYTRGTILLAFALIALASAATLLLPGHRRKYIELWRNRWRLIVASEALFLLFFALFWFIRWGNPDLWHPYMGGEKPMDFAFLNAVIKSTKFPPYDPWFAGGYLNYYYFGQLMAGTLIKLIGIVPNVAYNLTLPLWAAMTAMGAWSVTFNLVSRIRARSSAGQETGEEAPELRKGWMGLVLFGLVGAAFTIVLGNLGEVALILLKASEGIMTALKSTIPGLVVTVRGIVGIFEIIFGGKALPIPINEWYWDASRAIPTPPGESVITEFPFFTFLYADLHAHLLAMPLTFLSLSAALAVVLRDGARRRREIWSNLALLVFWALVIGAMRTTNTWDVPPHLLVALGALGIASFSHYGRLTWRTVWDVGWQFAVLFVLGWSVLYLPFWKYYGAFYNSIGIWDGARTPLWAYLVVHGLFLFGIGSYLIARSFEHGDGRRPDPFFRRIQLTLRYRRERDRLRRAGEIAGAGGLPVSRLLWLLVALIIVMEIFFFWPGRVDPKVAAEGAFAYEGFAVFGLGLPLSILGMLLVTRPGVSAVERLWAYLVLLGLAMSLGVEVIVLKGDIGRMNTVFKFYMQVWLMWSVAAAAALAWLLPRVKKWRHGQTAWVTGLAALVLCAALYPPLAASAKIRDRFDTSIGPGLDGWAYMTVARYHDWAGPEYDLKWDYQAIQWMLDNIKGSPTIVEGQVPEYRWGARYSINTGLPTILGWNWHERQQRAAAGEQQVWNRADDVTTIYSTTTPSQAMDLLHEYEVQYVIIGPLEHVYYPAQGLAKFDQMAADGLLQAVYKNEQVTIYQVVK